MLRFSDFKADIDAIIKDLAIEHVAIDWKIYYDLTVLDKENSTGIVNTYKTGNGWAAWIKLAFKGWDYNTILDAMAHELRHIWQEVNGIMVTKYEHGKQYDQPKVRNTKYGVKFVHSGNMKAVNTWTGTEFYPDAKIWSRMEYYYRPNEVDARAYAEQFVYQKTKKKRITVGVVGSVKFYKIDS